MNIKIKNFCMSENILFRENFELKKVSHIKTGGTAEVIIFPNSAIQLQSIIVFLKTLDTEFLVVGNLCLLLYFG